MRDLDEQTVIEAGGWDGRYAVVRAVGTLGDQAAAVVDANGDGADINLEFFCRTGDGWELCVSGGGAGDRGRGSHEDLTAEHDRDEQGWRLTLTPRVGEDDRSPVPASGTHGWYAFTPRRRWRGRGWLGLRRR